MNNKWLALIACLQLAFNVFIFSHGPKKEYHVPLYIPTKPDQQQVEPFRPNPDVKPDVKPEPPKPTLSFIEVPVISKRINEDSVYADIINRSKNPVLNETRPTNGHETTHMLNSQIRNESGKGNGFYVTQGRGFLVKEPKMRKSAVAAFIPSSCRGYRYPTYITGQREWDDMPTYLIDEWSAYNNGADVAIDDKNKGRKVENADEVSGCIEFSIYCVALCMAIEKNDPDYWKDETQFKEFVKWHLQRSQTLFEAGKDTYPSSGQDKLYNALRTSPDAAAMREFIKANFDSIWLK